MTTDLIDRFLIICGYIRTCLVSCNP